MNKIKSLLKWLFIDTLPFPWLVLFLGIHIVALIQYPDSTPLVNKYTSNILQFIGIVVVIKAVNDNVNIIDRGSLINSFREWLNACPLRRQHYTVQVNTANIVITAGEVKARVIRNPKTLEDKINYAFEEIERIEKDLGNSTEKLNTRIDDIKVSVGELRTSHENRLKDVDRRLSEVFIGGAKEEVFGIVCIFYSLVTSFFA